MRLTSWILIASCLISLYGSLWASADVASPELSAATLVSGLAKANAWIDHCAFTERGQLTDNGFYPYTRNIKGVAEYREDNGQIDLVTLESSRKKDGRLVWDSKTQYTKTRFIVNRTRRFEYEWGLNGKIWAGLRSSRVPTELRSAYLSLSTDESFGAFLNGRCWCNYDRTISSLLLGSKPQIDGSKHIDGTDCYRVTATTPYGVIRAWIAPDKSFNCLEFSIQKSSNNIYAEGPLSSLQINGQKVLSSLNIMDQVQLRRVGDRLVTVFGRYRTEMSLGDGTKASRTTISQRTHVDLSPDFAAMKAFLPADAPDGTRVYEAGLSGSTPLIFEWRGGHVVPRIDNRAATQIQHTMKPLAQIYGRHAKQGQNASLVWKIVAGVGGAIIVIVVAWFIRRRTISSGDAP